MTVSTLDPRTPQAFDAAATRRRSPFHPKVDHYRDGGMGGIGPDHSVVGFVATSALVRYRHHDGWWNGLGHHLGGSDHDRHVIETLREALRSGHGFHTPLMLEYDHHDGWAFLGEGNHRLAAAVAEDVPEVPLRVVRSRTPSYRREEGIGAPATHRPIPGAAEDYLPSDIHPAYLILG